MAVRAFWAIEVSRLGGEAVPRSREPRPIVFAVADRVERHDIPACCARFRALLNNQADDGDVVIDVEGLDRVDVAAVDLLARLKLIAWRRGRLLRIQSASPELRELLALTGLSEVVPVAVALAVELEGQTEEREELRGVEEEADPGDATS